MDEAADSIGRNEAKTPENQQQDSNSKQHGRKSVR